MKQRDEAVEFGLLEARLKYSKLRNKVTKLDIRNKKEYYRQRIDGIKHDGEQFWNTVNAIIGKKKSVCAFFVESDGMISTKPQDIAGWY